MGLAFFEWCEASLIGEAVRTSVWLFPVVESAHLLGLCILGAAVVVLDLRLCGVMLASVPIAELARSTRRWLGIGLAAMVGTGVPLFLSEAVKCYYNPSFWVKMAALPVAAAFGWGVRRWLARRPAIVTSGATRVAGAVSLALWFVVAAAGRWIGFSS